MSDSEPETSIIRIKQQIDHLKQQIEATADPKEKRRLQSRLKELQIEQLWRISQDWDEKGDEDK